MALSLNLVVGISGELSLGHAGFMSVGAFSGVIVSGAMNYGGVTNGAIRLIVAMVVGAILVEKIVIHGKALGDLRILQILPHQRLVHRETVFLKELDHIGKIHPAPGRDEPLAVHVGFDFYRSRSCGSPGSWSRRDPS